MCSDSLTHSEWNYYLLHSMDIFYWTDQIKVNPTSAELQSNLVRLYIDWSCEEPRKLDEAYSYVCEVEARKPFPHSLLWYKTCMDVAQVSRITYIFYLCFQWWSRFSTHYSQNLHLSTCTEVLKLWSMYPHALQGVYHTPPKEYHSNYIYFTLYHSNQNWKLFSTKYCFSYAVNLSRKCRFVHAKPTLYSEYVTNYNLRTLAPVQSIS